MTEIRLRFPQHPQADLPLGPGRHALAWRDGAFEAVEGAGSDPAITLCIDPRGLWLAVGAGVVHVNGRRVRRLAMLRVGDMVHVDGAAIQLLGASDVPRRIPEPRAADVRGGEAASRLVLRGVGGRHHGRCFALGRPRTVGRLAGCDIRIDAPEFAERHARLEPHGDQVVLRGLADDASVVNGERVRDAMLVPGDQVVFDAHHRFVVEAPGRPSARGADGDAEAPASDGEPASTIVAQARRMPWLLLAAVLLAAALAALLLFGTA